MGKLKKHYKEVVEPTWNYAGRLLTDRDHEMNAIVGLAAESGEALDVCKKMWFHTPKDRRHELKLELGDVLYYWLVALDVFDFTIDEILALNREKLESRHPELGKVVERFGKEAIV
jgi:phosphoribosyl-ATP pyrophosphohydrolase